MSETKPTLPWNCSTQASYVPLSHQGTIVGFCDPDYAGTIAKFLNERELLEKALYQACYDLVARTGGSPDTIAQLVQRYRAKVDRPLQGSALISVLLRERQIDLDLTEEEFAKFCDSYRLSRSELREIYRGEEVESHQLIPIARILGKTVDQVMEAWKGDE